MAARRSVVDFFENQIWASIVRRDNFLQRRAAVFLQLFFCERNDLYEDSEPANDSGD